VKVKNSTWNRNDQLILWILKISNSLNRKVGFPAVPIESPSLLGAQAAHMSDLCSLIWDGGPEGLAGFFHQTRSSTLKGLDLALGGMMSEENFECMYLRQKFEFQLRDCSSVQRLYSGVDCWFICR